jgi:hypothetical protein
MLVTKCIVIVLLYQCKTVSLYRSTLYIQCVIREETRVSVPNICVISALASCTVIVIFTSSSAASG